MRKLRVQTFQVDRPRAYVTDPFEIGSSTRLVQFARALTLGLPCRIAAGMLGAVGDIVIDERMIVTLAVRQLPVRPSTSSAMTSAHLRRGKSFDYMYSPVCGIRVGIAFGSILRATRLSHRPRTMSLVAFFPSQRAMLERAPPRRWVTSAPERRREARASHRPRRRSSSCTGSTAGPCSPAPYVLAVGRRLATDAAGERFRRRHALCRRTNRSFPGRK